VWVAKVYLPPSGSQLLGDGMFIGTNCKWVLLTLLGIL